MPGPISFRGVRIGVPVCEDIWTPDVVECIAETGGEILLVANGSPFEAGKGHVRQTHSVSRVVESGLPLVYLNQVGGQDELVFDGASFVLNADRPPRFSFRHGGAIVTTTWTRGPDGWTCAPGERVETETGLAEIYQAMVVGLRDQCDQERLSRRDPGHVRRWHRSCTVGGGRRRCARAGQSALRDDALPYTSAESPEDAAAAARLLGVRYDTISIGLAMEAFETMLAEQFAGTNAGITEENVQSRSRGLTLMALSNTSSGTWFCRPATNPRCRSATPLFMVICVVDIPYFERRIKQQSLSFASGGTEHTRRQPSPRRGGDAGADHQTTELRLDQKDEDLLPPYPVLDAILTELVENETRIAEIIEGGQDPETVMRVWRLLDRAEYKRRQRRQGQDRPPCLRARPALPDHKRFPRCSTPSSQARSGRGRGHGHTCPANGNRSRCQAGGGVAAGPPPTFAKAGVPVVLCEKGRIAQSTVPELGMDPQAGPRSPRVGPGRRQLRVGMRSSPGPRRRHRLHVVGGGDLSAEIEADLAATKRGSKARPFQLDSRLLSPAEVDGMLGQDRRRSPGGLHPERQGPSPPKLSPRSRERPGATGLSSWRRRRCGPSTGRADASPVS